MPRLNLRILFLCVLLAAANAGAQKPLPARATAHSARHSIPESYQFTITFKRSFHDKPRDSRTYTLLASVGEILPAIRDDGYYRTDATCKDSNCIIEGGTDVDILSLKPRGKFITVALKISTHTYSNDPPDFLPKLPVTFIHQYLVTPTVPIGKRTTIYSSIDDLKNNTVDVELLIQPCDFNLPNVPEEKH
jgi:hypothetical protein